MEKEWTVVLVKKRTIIVTIMVAAIPVRGGQDFDKAHEQAMAPVNKVLASIGQRIHFCG